MKLYEVVFQDEAECTGFALIYELVVAESEEAAIEKAWKKYYDACGHAIKPKRDRHYVDNINHISELDGYEIIVRDKIN